MKKLILLLIAVNILQSCVDQARSETVFTMINETDKDVTILAFDTVDAHTGVYDMPLAADIVQIAPNSSYSVTRYSGLDDTISFAFYSVQSIDSIRVIFNNEKIKIYTLAEAAGTPDISVFRGEGSDGDYRHIITEEDYNTAQDCDPDCERTE